MSIRFPKDFLQLDDNTIIPFVFIESMRMSDGENLTIDRLKGDSHLEVVMTSGKEYTVSVKKQVQPSWIGDYTNIDLILESIIDKWHYTISGKA